MHTNPDNLKQQIMSNMELQKKDLLQSIVSLIDGTRERVALTINSELTLLYWNIGKQINEDILKNNRADYGKNIIAELSRALITKYGDGFSKRNLHNFVKFNELYPDSQIVQTVSAQLSWSHIYSLIYIKEKIKREFYTQLCKHERWSERTLQDRMSSMLYERTAISKKPELTIVNELELLKKEKKMTPDLAFRDPYFLDFLDCMTHTVKKIWNRLYWQTSNALSQKWGLSLHFWHDRKELSLIMKIFTSIYCSFIVD